MYPSWGITLRLKEKQTFIITDKTDERKLCFRIHAKSVDLDNLLVVGLNNQQKLFNLNFLIFDNQPFSKNREISIAQENKNTLQKVLHIEIVARNVFLFKLERTALLFSNNSSCIPPE